MRKGLIKAGLAAVSVLALAGCASTKVEYKDLQAALNDCNYTLDICMDDYTSTEYFDKANKASIIVANDVDRIEKTYRFEVEGGVGSVTYTNYTVVDSNIILNANNELKYYSSMFFEGESIDDYVCDEFSFDILFKDESNKIVSAGEQTISQNVMTTIKAEVSNVKVNKNNIKFNLDVYTIDAVSDIYNSSKNYNAKLYDLNSTKVEVPADVKANLEK